VGLEKLVLILSVHRRDFLQYAKGTPLLLGSLPQKTRRPPPPDLTIRLEAFYHHLTLGLFLPEIPEGLFLIRSVLTDPLKGLSSSASPR
jgi:hypothetical protein